MLASGCNNLSNSIHRLVKKTFKLIIAKKKQQYTANEINEKGGFWLKDCLPKLGLEFYTTCDNFTRFYILQTML